MYKRNMIENNALEWAVLSEKLSIDYFIANYTFYERLYF